MLAHSMPIAIIGIGCRLPGNIATTEELWEFLAKGQSAWSPVPNDRYNETSFYHPDPDHNGTTNHRGGHFLSQDISAFDAAFFGVSPNEARAMDPQQRLLLETTYEAFESAGISKDVAQGSDTAVYTAMFTRDYDRNVYKDPSNIPKYHVTGSGDAIMSNRISYIFNLKGPSMTIDTGCSGSMVALHQACQSLQIGESSMALASGVSLMLNPDHMFGLSSLHMLNSNGRSYPFDVRGSGYGRGEGVVTLLLKRLDDALEARDPIRAIIRNTSVNQDGKTSGITLPNGQAQEILGRRSFQNANLDPRGTVAGDLIEMKAIANVFCEDRRSSLYVGSIKSNIGHLESASGLAGVMKAILILEKKLIPPNHGFENPKAGLQLDDWNIKIPTKLEQWPGSGVPRISVNSFGYGGTNALIVLEKAPDFPRYRLFPRGLGPERKTLFGKDNSVAFTEDHTPQLFIISAMSEKSTYATVKNLREFIVRRQPDTSVLKDLAYTLSTRRTLMRWRLSIVATQWQELTSAMQPEAIRGCVKIASSRIKVTFIFTGQGAQWFAMGRELMSVSSPFNDSLSTSKTILQDLGAQWDLIHELSLNESASRIDRSEIAQPATTALQIALVDLLRSIQVYPQAVLGHSSGEIAAAYAAGYLSQVAALKISYHRSFISKYCKELIPVRGAMLVIGLGEDDVLKHIINLRQGTVSIACVNSPVSTTVSGDEPAVLELKESLDGLSIFSRKLNVDTAYHSYHMQTASDGYISSLEGLQTKVSDQTIKFFSTVTGTEKTAHFGATYWVENLTSKVRYRDALSEYTRVQQDQAQTLQSKHILIEIGPHSALSGPTRQTIGRDCDSLDYAYLPTLVRNQNSVVSVLSLVGKLFEEGLDLSFDVISSFNPARVFPTVVPNLPAYPWDHSNSFWFESRLSREYRLRRDPHHDLLGVRVPSSTSIEPRWRYVVGLDNLPWLAQHVVDKLVVFPGAGYLCMAIEAVKQISRGGQVTGHTLIYTLRDVCFLKALYIPLQPAKVEIQLSLIPQSNSPTKETTSVHEFRVTALSQKHIWYEYCRGTISVQSFFIGEMGWGSEREMNDKETQAALQGNMQPEYFQSTSPKKFYKDLDSNGNTYGPEFAVITELDISNSQAAAVVDIPDIASIMPSNFMQPHTVHPATLDALMHPSLALYAQQYGPGSIMPVFIREMMITSTVETTPGSRLRVHTAFTPGGVRSGNAQIQVTNLCERLSYAKVDPVITVSGLELRGLGETQLNVPTVSRVRKICHQIIWNSDVDFLSPSQIEHLHVPRQSCLDAIENKLELLNQVAFIYIQNCLHQITETNLKIVQPHLSELVRWMEGCRFLCHEGHHTLTSEVALGEAEELLVHQGVEGEMLSRVGAGLVSILKGDVNPLQLMLDDDLLYRFYADGSLARSHDHMIQYVRYLCFKNPRMAILEIGAGTGGTTIPLLNGMSRNNQTLFQSYEFTDISAGFFDRARSSLQRWIDQIQFRTLDIETDPLDQGFMSQSYDLIVATNVLHATESIDRTLKNVHKLLKPGGRLMLVEITKPQAYLGVIFGTLPGWWRGISDGRTNDPLLSKEQWHNALVQCSFNGIELAINDVDGPAQASLMMVSRVVSPLHTALPRPVKLLIEQETLEILPEFVHAFCKELEVHGFRPSFESWDTHVLAREDCWIVIDNGERPLLIDPTAVKFQKITTLMIKGSNVFWVSIQKQASATRNPRKALVTGLARSAHAENEHLNLVTMDVQQDLDKYSPSFLKDITTVFAQSIREPSKAGGPREREYIYRDDQMLIPRVMPDPRLNEWIARTVGKPEIRSDIYKQPQRSLRLHIDKMSADGAVEFVDDGSLQMDIGPLDVEVDVRAHGVSYAEAMVTLGHPKSSVISECAGFVTAIGSKVLGLCIGDRVCGWGGLPFASRIRVPSENVYPLPDSMSFNIGASIPVAFMTAYYSLVQLADLQRGQIVLVHAAMKDVGQAALLIAQHIGAITFASTANEMERTELTRLMNLPPTHVLSSQLRSFKNVTAELTHGHGWDLVLDCSSSEDIYDSWACVASLGALIKIKDLGTASKDRKRDVLLEKNATFISFNFACLWREQRHKTAKLLSKVMSMFEDKDFTPRHSVMSMSLSRISDAFKLARGKQLVGKIVLEADESTTVDTISLVRPKASLDREATYIIAGGLGDFGQRLCQLMIERGARHIWIMSRRILQPDQRQKIERKFHSMAADARFYYSACDIALESQVQEAVTKTLAMNIPPIKGVIQASMVLKDSTLGKMSLEDYQIPLQTKLHGTYHLSRAFESSPLDFFLVLSSVCGIIGYTGSANYAAGNAFEDAFARNYTDSKCHYMSLDIGLVHGADVNTQVIEQSLQRQGLTSIKPEELLAFFEYAMSTDSSIDCCKQAIIGFNEESLQQVTNTNSTPKSAMFCHVSQLTNDRVPISSEMTSKSLPKTNVGIEDPKEVIQILAFDIAQKVSGLVTLNDNRSILDLPMSDIGLDSLMAIELKNWINREYDAQVQVSDITDQESITTLAVKVASISTIVKQSHELPSIEQIDHPPANDLPMALAITERQATSTITRLPLQPLPALEDTLQLFLDTARSFCSDEEFESMSLAIKEFKPPDSLGHRLHDRLVEKSKDPRTENWLADLYVRRRYLRLRTPLVACQSYYGSHPLSETPHGQAERAAIISIAAFRFMQALHSGGLEPQYLFGQTMDPDSYQWLFNACREPHEGEDRIQKYPNSKYIVVFRYGYAFKVALEAQSQTVSLEALKVTFEKILAETPKAVSWVGILTADKRDRWAKFRQLLLELSDGNKASIQTIEAASFLVCLDDASPEHPNDRFYQFLFGDGSNRWYDKTLQFVVCKNGVSASVMEHSSLDLNSIEPLQRAINKAILQFDTRTYSGNHDTEPVEPVDLQELSLTINATMDNFISQFRQDFEANTSRYSFSNLEMTSLSSDLLRACKCPVQSGIQLAIQLASRRFFGYNPPALETISMAHFRKGRVEVNHIIQAPMAAFLAAANERATATTRRLRPLLYDGVKAHIKSLTRASKGRGFSRHLMAMEWMLQDGEILPALFTHPVYTKMKPGKLVTSSFPTGWLEGGFVYPVPRSILLYFEVKQHSVTFSIFGNDADADSFRELLATAAEEIRVLLTSGTDEQ